MRGKTSQRITKMRVDEDLNKQKLFAKCCYICLYISL